MVERGDIAQLVIFRQGEFFAAEFLMAVELQHLRRAILMRDYRFHHRFFAGADEVNCERQSNLDQKRK